MPKTDALIHAFLSTEDSCGLGVIINGNFSTDPSRCHLIFDDTTQSVIDSLAKLYVKLTKTTLFSNNTDVKQLISALMPYSDVRMMQLMPDSFEKRFVNAVKDSENQQLIDVSLMPKWFNPNDFKTILTASGCKTINKIRYAIPELSPFLKFLGAK